MSYNNLYIKQVNTNKISEINDPGVNLTEELCEITKIRIATLEGCSCDWIRWINKDLPYDKHEEFFEKRTILKRAFPNINQDFTVYYEIVEKDLINEE